MPAKENKYQLIPDLLLKYTLAMMQVQTASLATVIHATPMT